MRVRAYGRKGGRLAKEEALDVSEGSRRSSAAAWSGEGEPLGKGFGSAASLTEVDGAQRIAIVAMPWGLGMRSSGEDKG